MAIVLGIQIVTVILDPTIAPVFYTVAFIAPFQESTGIS
jgi:hypothetical protein